MKESKLGHDWLLAYSRHLVAADANALAGLFHKGIAYIVNGEARVGADGLCVPKTWEFILSRVEFNSVASHNLYEPHPGHVFYHEVLKVRFRATDAYNEGHFGDEAVINESGKMLLMNRVADPAYFAAFDAALS